LRRSAFHVPYSAPSSSLRLPALGIRTPDFAGRRV
jgi:hypothetical protein